MDYSGRILIRTTAFTMDNNLIPVGKLSAGMYKLVVKIDDMIMQQSFIK